MGSELGLGFFTPFGLVLVLAFHCSDFRKLQEQKGEGVMSSRRAPRARLDLLASARSCEGFIKRVRAETKKGVEEILGIFLFV